MAMAYHITGASHPGSGAPPVAMAFLQTKPRIGPANGPLEREADAVADAIVSNQSLMTGAIPQAPDIQRKCAACESAEHDTVRLQRNGEEDEEILTKPAVAGNSSPPMSAAHFAADAVRSGGTPLSPGARAYFEPRFGRGLTDVRVHTHGRAKAAARSIGARAYTLGRDVAFADGEFAPHTSRGRHLLAHELTHVSQQGEATSQIIRRASIGSSNPPYIVKSGTWTNVPADELGRVVGAMGMIDEIVNDRDVYSACHDQFATHCPGGNSNSLTKVWRRARVWRIADVNEDALGRGFPGGKDIAYSYSGFRAGTESLASTLLHEAGHNCGIPAGAIHWYADKVALYCLGEKRSEFSASLGATIGSPVPILLYSYRRFLHNWASGRLRSILGIDFNPFSTGVEIPASVLSPLPPGFPFPADFGSAMVGAQMNLGGIGGFGGTRYGGISIRLETGLGVGRFRVPSPTAGGFATTALGPGAVVQIGGRAEFAIPDPRKDKEGLALPISIGAAYRAMHPINRDAEILHSLLGTLEYRF